MISKPEFVHLHNHSEYSLFDSVMRFTGHDGKASELLKGLAKDGAKGLGLTDHGNMYGAMEFYNQCSSVGLKPIVGCEMYLAKGKRTDRGHSQKENCHLTVLARNFEGYQNLMQLVSKAFLEGFYFDPRIDKELLAQHSKGLVVLSGCLKSEVCQAISDGNLAAAEKLCVTYRDILEPGSFFLEIMDHGIDKERQATKALLEIHERTKIPLVATNDCHYAKKADSEAQDVRVCIATGKKLDDPPGMRLKFEGQEFYFKTAEQMHELFSFAPESLKNTLKIAEMCHLELPKDQMLLPEFDVPRGHTQDSYLEELCIQGLKARFGSVSDAHMERLRYELGVIKRMGFAGYFLIVSDFIAHARKEGIPVGPGRGSGAGALVAYALKITNLDPLEHNLLFERFLNPDRKSMPDLDIDFADTGRDKVIEYVRRKYGESNVAQIITFGSMGAKLVIRDVGRVLGMPLSEVDRIAKIIPGGPNVSLYETMQKNPDMIAAAKEPQVKKLLDLSLKLEGLKRHTGVHAAGTVITKEAVVKYSPLAKGRNEVVTTQYDGEILPKLGLLKVDFLGLRTLSIIDNAVKLIHARGKPDFDIDKIPQGDAKTFELLRSAKALAVFQLDSAGMRDLLYRMKPTDFADIVSLIALFRPGPMQSGMLDMFVERKHGKTKIAYDHPLLEPILKDTYGCIVFQEQVMEISKKLADFTPGQADGLRKAMGKKIPEELEKMRDTFVKGAAKHKIAAKLANKVYDQLVQFGGYGFNKCLVGSTRIIDAETGASWTIGELARTGTRIKVWSLASDMKRTAMPTKAAWSNGVRRVYRLKTLLGKEIRATDNHPFLTPRGWVDLGELKSGDRIAAARSIPAEHKKASKNSAVFSGSPHGHQPSATLRGVEVLENASDIIWESVSSISPDGMEEVFDLEVPGTHNFLADGLFVHNSHSAAYGLVAYQTAYLKANYPIEFMCAVATSEIGHSAVAVEGKENKLVTYLEEAKDMGIKVLAPDVQKSEAVFSIEDPNSIRFGLAAVKNVGAGAVDSMLAARKDGPFKDLNDFCARVDLHSANMKVLESLVKAGAMDTLEPGVPIEKGRARLLAGLEDAVKGQARLREDLAKGQGQLFGFEAAAPPVKDEPPALSAPDILGNEKEVLGFYFSGHPLNEFKDRLKIAATHEIAALSAEITTPVRLAGMMSQVKRLVTKSKGEQYAKCVLEDLSGEVGLLVFPKAYASLGPQLKAGQIVVVGGRVSFRGEGEAGTAELIVEEIVPLDNAIGRWAKRLRLFCRTPELEEATLRRLAEALEKHRGRCPVVLEHETSEGTALLEVETRVLPDQNLLESIEQILGEKSWQIESAS